MPRAVRPHRTRMEKIEYTVTEFPGREGKCRGTLADLIFDADMIPRCGLIPPFRVVAAVLRTGGGEGGMSPGCIWQAVDKLQSLTPEDFANRHRVRQFSDELRLDYSAPDTEHYGVWVDSLVTRGYLPGGPFGKARR